MRASTRSRRSRRQQSQLSFEELLSLSPKLRALYAKVRRIHDDGLQPYFCRNEHWYGYGVANRPGLRNQLEDLVGWGASQNSPVELKTSRSYDTAYHELYDSLPPCRGGCCPSPEELYRFQPPEE